jgi:hypothetical protein
MGNGVTGYKIRRGMPCLVTYLQLLANCLDKLRHLFAELNEHTVNPVGGIKDTEDHMSGIPKEGRSTCSLHMATVA